MCAALARGLTLDEMCGAAATLRPVPGRFEPVPDRSLGFTVVVDYAHTDDALENLIAVGARAGRARGRVITMFGCGGDRDKTKRPKMGRVAGEGSDLVVVTSDNPRSEEPMAIIEEVLVGVRGACGRSAWWRRIGGRRLRWRFVRRGRGILCCWRGRGMRRRRRLRSGAVHFDDVEEAERVLREMGKTDSRRE